MGQVKSEKSGKFLANNKEDFSMKRRKFSEQRIAFVLRQAEEGVSVRRGVPKVGGQGYFYQVS